MQDPFQTVTDKDERTLLEDETSIYAKPMQGTRPLTSEGTLTIKAAGSKMRMDDWRLEKHLGPAPKVLWEQYNPDSDPTRTGHRTTGDLLDGSKSGNLRLMTGFVLRAPKPRMSADNSAKVLYSDAPSGLKKKYFPETTESSDDWLPGVRKEGSAQWVDVHNTWGGGDRITAQEPAIADAELEPSSAVTETTRELSLTAEATSHTQNSWQEETEPIAVQLVAKWEELMHWGRGALSRCATMSAQRNERFMHLFADAPSISVGGLSDGELRDSSSKSS
ncbi:hypothetical protein BO82DRAFT_358265 [Aspergillus uvarum CBS 121591]|uniref:Uncharacterized protein n=1 Tax=Aspergillus uvarum CBS 121591 TaxID=1448315 RepID=A0A319C0Y0_9EURO|nr:hypothetical protein BO82DRAFT_358265 [Aspergillus uvarum CBS 121591]PYH77429.1 hypothetical protein BO82DRAFT_358265 [Aspergillus uvarum CBS 121591]